MLRSAQYLALVEQKPFTCEAVLGDKTFVTLGAYLEPRPSRAGSKGQMKGDIVDCLPTPSTLEFAFLMLRAYHLILPS
jgi:hypothetical protein